eukprot:CAMPEP_0197590556 /NCGR_PEP_ID=MMETSP1326-20131121/11481_1 /TAXON_ID=1155430 /ORGANISM="Genus nov. species nov., Strain RCC2288" /LENGTH=494 /DNA_ID=CAMNT_0043155661 /DNA_START=216 /DNA_END=1700 /DNA_ORIENTATION=+
MLHGGSGLPALLAAATEVSLSGLRKTQSADEIQENVQPMQSVDEDGHLSDSAIAPTRERKKGVAWTEEEHRLFLLGLQKLGKGDWRGISRHFVQSRTPTQVASHAQKYFIRQNNLNKRKRRSSLFDIVSDTPAERGGQHPAPAGINNAVTKVSGVAVNAFGVPVATPVGGLSTAFATTATVHRMGFNPTGMPPPFTFSMHAAVPPQTSRHVAMAKVEVVGPNNMHAIRAAAGTDSAVDALAALTMAGSPAAAAAAAAAASPLQASVSPPNFSAQHTFGTTPASAVTAGAFINPLGLLDPANAAAAGNPFAAVMAMGQMGAMGHMGSWPPNNWVAHYHQFLQQMQMASAAQQQQQHHQYHHSMPPPAGVTFPPLMQMQQSQQLQQLQQQQQGLTGSAGAASAVMSTLRKPTAVHASPAALAAPTMLRNIIGQQNQQPQHVGSLMAYGAGAGAASALTSFRGIGIGNGVAPGVAATAATGSQGSEPQGNGTAMVTA